MDAGAQEGSESERLLILQGFPRQVSPMVPLRDLRKAMGFFCSGFAGGQGWLVIGARQEWRAGVVVEQK